jgi:hypothetical protein
MPSCDTDSQEKQITKNRLNDWAEIDCLSNYNIRFNTIFAVV